MGVIIVLKDLIIYTKLAYTSRQGKQVTLNDGCFRNGFSRAKEKRGLQRTWCFEEKSLLFPPPLNIFIHLDQEPSEMSVVFFFAKRLNWKMLKPSLGQLKLHIHFKSQSCIPNLSVGVPAEESQLQPSPRDLRCITLFANKLTPRRRLSLGFM